MPPTCENCGAELSVNPVKNPNVDFVSVVCDSCDKVVGVSMIRLEQKVYGGETLA